MNANIIQAPLPSQANPDFPVIQYADDTVLIMPASSMQMELLKNLILHFTVFTGLRVNFDKSAMVLINTENDVMRALAGRLGCSIGSFPFTYLGLPLSVHRLKKIDFQQLVDKVAGRLIPWQGRLITSMGRATFIMSVLTVQTTHHITLFVAPTGTLEEINKLERAFL